MKNLFILIICICISAVSAQAKTLSNSNVPQLKGRIVTVPQGAVFNAKMQSNVNSETLKAGDIVAATLTKDWMHEEELIAEQGSILYGEAVQVEPAGNAYKNGKIELKFTEIVTPKGETIKLSSNTYVLAVDMNRTLKIMGNILCGTIIGVVVGALYTAASGGNVVLGLIIGAGAGITTAAVFSVAQTGDNVELPRNTPLKIKLSEPTKVNIYDY